MQTLLITPKDKAQLDLLTNLMKAMNIKPTILTDEQKEDLGLAMLMGDVDKTKKVSEASILKKLKS
jgi:hypothetical protein